MAFRLFPQDFNFYDCFDKQVENVVAGADFFKEVVNRGEVTDADSDKMKAIEHEGDRLAYSIIDNLNKTFITPIDREDIHALAKKMDDINDMMRTIISRKKVYKLKGVNENLVHFANLIDDAVHGLECAIKGLRNLKNSNNILKSCVDVNKLEGEGDKLRDKVLGELFENEKDPIEIIKWKEIYQDAETVLDICKQVAHTVESILVKQA